MADRRIPRREFLRRASVVGGAAAACGLGHSMLGAAQLGLTAGAPEPRAAAKPQFSLAHLTVLGCAPPEMTYIAARAGYDFVSYRLIYMGLPGEPNYDLGKNRGMLRQTKTALSTTGLTLHDIEVARISDGLDPNKYLPAMEVAAELGSKRVIANNWSSDRSFAVDCYGRLCDLAKPLGLTVDFEFVTFATGSKTLADALDVVRAAKRTNGGVLVDTLHCSRSRVTLPELSAVPREWIHFAHLCDGPAEIPPTVEGLTQAAREARLYPGEGAIDMAAILNQLPPVPYSLEIPHLARVKELGYGEHAARCLDRARTYLATRLSTGT